MHFLSPYLASFANFTQSEFFWYSAAIFFFGALALELLTRVFKAYRSHKEGPLSWRMEKALAYFAEGKKHTRITNDIYQDMTNASDATATRELQKLAELGLLEQRGKARGIYYVPTSKTTEASLESSQEITPKKPTKNKRAKRGKTGGKVRGTGPPAPRLRRASKPPRTPKRASPAAEEIVSPQETLQPPKPEKPRRVRVLTE